MRILFVCAILIVSQICVLIFVMNPNYTRAQISIEYQSIQSEFGKAFALQVVQRANSWVRYFYIKKPTIKGLPRSKAANKLEVMRIKAYRYPDNYRNGLYQILLRFSLLSLWLPVLLFIFTIFILGAAQRRKRKLNFSYSTVERNRIAIRVLTILLVAISILVSSILAIHALTLLVSCLGLAISAMFVVASSKRSL